MDARVRRHRIDVIWLLHNGSYAGQWLAHYGVLFAGRSADKQLQIVHVLGEDVDEQTRNQRFTRIESDGARQGIEVTTTLLPRKESVWTTLEAHLPHGPEHLILCGMRVRARERGFLRRTTSEFLLRHQSLRVLAIRIAKPGVLGAPRRLLLPLAGHPRGLTLAWPFLNPLLPSVERVCLLRVVPVPRLWILKSAAPEEHHRPQMAAAYLKDMANDLRERWHAPLHVETHVRVGSDWEREILAQAGKFSAELILMGASERGLIERSTASRINTILSRTPCDVGIYRGV